MKSFKVQQVATLATAIAASFLTVSCTSSKITQCANTIEVVNQTVVSTKAISNSGTKGDIQTIEKLVEIFDKAANDLEAVNVSDEKLNTYKNQFLAMYKGTTDVTKQLIVSIKERKSTKVNEGLKKYASSVSPELDLVTGLNQYCQEPDKKSVSLVSID